MARRNASMKAARGSIEPSGGGRSPAAEISRSQDVEDPREDPLEDQSEDQRDPMTDHQDDGPGFTEAMQELETILQRIDDDTVDVDRLAIELRRATELLETCRSKIRKAEVEVHQIVQQLDGGG